MKKFLLIIGSLFILILCGILALPFLVPVDTIKSEVQKVVQKKTGRSFSFSDDVKVSVWPDIKVSLRDVSLSNAEWGKAENILSLKELNVQLALIPLLSKQVEVKKFVLQDPVIALEVNKDGKGNWVFEKDKEDIEAKTVNVSKAIEPSQKAEDFMITLGDVKIDNGYLSYLDHKTGKKEELKTLNVDVSLPSFEGALDIDGDVNYREQNIVLNLHIDRLKDMVDRKATGAKFTAKTLDLETKFDGLLDAKHSTIEGDLSLNAKSIANISEWLSGAKTESPVNTANISGKVKASSESVSFTNSKFSADEIKGTGDIYVVNLNIAKPFINTKVEVDYLDLDALLNGNATKKVTVGKVSETKKLKSSKWSEEKIDLSGLRGVNADIRVKTGGLTLYEIKMGPSVVEAKLQSGILNLKVSDTALFGGAFTTNTRIDARNNKPVIKTSLELKNVQMASMVKQFAGTSKVNGSTNSLMEFTTSGYSIKDMVSALNGSGELSLTKGAIKGIDLANIMGKISPESPRVVIGKGQTAFNDLTGNFKIRNGVLSNNNMFLKSDVLTVKGAGNVDLPNQRIKYRLTPRLINPPAEEEGIATGMNIPLDITGDFSSIKIKPDFSAIVKNIIEKPEDIKGTLKQLKDIGKGVGGDKDQAKELLKGLFGR